MHATCKVNVVFFLLTISICLGCGEKKNKVPDGFPISETEKTGRTKAVYLTHRQQVLDLYNAKKEKESFALIDSLSSQFAQVDDTISGFYDGLQGWVYFHTKHYQKSILPLEKAASLFERYGLESKLNGIYNNLGAAYGQLGDHTKAIQNYQAAIRLNEENSDSVELTRNHKNLCQAYFNVGDLQNAEWHNRLGQKYQANKDGSFELQAAEIALARGHTADALRIGQQLKASRPDLFDINNKDAASENLLAFGSILLTARHTEEAIPYLKKSLELLPIDPTIADWKRAKNCNLLGDAFLKKGNPQQALRYFQSAIQAATPTFHPLHDLDNPPTDSLPTEVWAMEALNGKTAALEQISRQKRPALTKNETVQYVRAALESALCAIQIIQQLKTAFVEDDSRLWLGEYAFQNFYEKPMVLAIRFSELTGDKSALEKAFLFASKSKASVLRTALLEKEHMFHAGVSSDSIRLLRDLRLAAAALQNQLNDAPSDSTRSALFQVKRKIDQFRNNLHLSLLKPDTATFLLKNLQKQLDDTSLLMEYFLGEKVLYIFTVSNDGFDVEQKSISTDFKQVTDGFRRSVSDWDWINDSAARAEKTYLRSATNLFDFLLKDALVKHPKTQRLFVVPDKNLARLPFSAFLTQPFSGGWKDLDLPVLIKKMAVSYRFSSDIYTENESLAKAIPRYGFGGFGTNYRDPFTFSTLEKSNDTMALHFLLALRGGQDTLNFADSEVDSIARLTGGQKWVNERATKPNFLSNASDYNILHLSLHTVETDPHDPTGLAILFSKATETDANILTSSELYALNLNTEMAVISSCESGLGQFKHGEGMLSLGRAMALAGCRATVINLWKADDRASRDQMISFYKNLKSGQSKDIALQNTLLYYLNNTVSERSIPPFWANFSAVGDMRPLVFTTETSQISWGWYLLGVTTLILLFVYWRYKKRKRYGEYL